MAANRRHARGQWKPEEDEELRKQVRKYGETNWVKISNEVITRSPKQCRERWHQNLKDGLNLHPISKEEGERINQLVAQLGQKWAEIARQLNNRSDNAVKNWWNGQNNKQKRVDARIALRARQQHRYDQNSHRAMAQQVAQSYVPRYHTNNGATYPQSSFTVDPSTTFVSQASAQPSSYSYQMPVHSTGPGQDFMKSRFSMESVMPTATAYQYQPRTTSFDSMPSLTTEATFTNQTCSPRASPQSSTLALPVDGWRCAPMNSLPRHSVSENSMSSHSLAQHTLPQQSLSQQPIPQQPISQHRMPQQQIPQTYGPISYGYYQMPEGYDLPILKSHLSGDQFHAKHQFNFRDPWRNDMYSTIGAQLPTPQSSVPSPSTVVSAPERQDLLANSPEKDTRMVVNNLLH